MKEVEVERGSLEDLNRILELAKEQGLKVAVIGGWAVRAYTSTRLRYTKDIDIAVPRKADLPKLRKILERVGYSVKDRPHGLSAYRKVRGVAIVVNAIVEELETVERVVNPFYSRVNLSVKADVAAIEDLLILKARIGRERDLVDIYLLVLEASSLIDVRKLKQRLEEREFAKGYSMTLKRLLNWVGTKKFHAIWEDFLRRKITKEEESRLWMRMNELAKSLS